MRQFNEISALWRTPTFNKAFYQDVALRWKGIGLRHLFLVIFLTWAVTYSRATYSVTHYLNTSAPTDLKDFPPITIKAGHASSPVPQPYIWRDEAGRPVFVLDTTGATKMPADVGAKMLLTETTLIQDDGPAGGTKTHPLAGFPDMTVDSTTILGWITTFRNLILPVLLPLTALFLLVYRLLLALLFAAIGLGFAAMCGVRLSYAALLRLAATAMTADLLISGIFWTINFQDGCFGWILGHILTLTYLFVAVKMTANAIRPTSAFEVQPLPSAPIYPPNPPISAPPQEEPDQRFP